MNIKNQGRPFKTVCVYYKTEPSYILLCSLGDNLQTFRCIVYRLWNNHSFLWCHAYKVPALVACSAHGLSSQLYRLSTQSLHVPEQDPRWDVFCRYHHEQPHTSLPNCRKHLFLREDPSIVRIIYLPYEAVLRGGCHSSSAKRFLLSYTWQRRSVLAPCSARRLYVLRETISHVPSFPKKQISHPIHAYTYPHLALEGVNSFLRGICLTLALEV